DVAAALLTDLLDIAARARAGETIDGPTRSLTTQATKTACLFSARGSSGDAKSLLDMLADGVRRQENQYQQHDQEHVQACVEIATHHPDLAYVALARLFDLAEVGTHDALEMLHEPQVLNTLREASTDAQASVRLTPDERTALLARLRAMAAAGRYDAGIAVAALGGTDELVTQRA